VVHTSAPHSRGFISTAQGACKNLPLLTASVLTPAVQFYWGCNYALPENNCGAHFWAPLSRL